MYVGTIYTSHTKARPSYVRFKKKKNLIERMEWHYHSNEATKNMCIYLYLQASVVQYSLPRGRLSRLSWYGGGSSNNIAHGVRWRNGQLNFLVFRSFFFFGPGEFLPN